MKTTKVSNAEWKNLGELELVFSADMESAMSTWLEAVLEPLGLPNDCEARILNSAQEAVGRIMQSNHAGLAVGHIHLLILITPDQSSEGKTWGFFRIEKLDSVENDFHPHDHSIEFYLYVDL